MSRCSGGGVTWFLQRRSIALILSAAASLLETFIIELLQLTNIWLRQIYAWHHSIVDWLSDSQKKRFHLNILSISHSLLFTWQNETRLGYMTFPPNILSVLVLGLNDERSGHFLLTCKRFTSVRKSVENTFKRENGLRIVSVIATAVPGTVWGRPTTFPRMFENKRFRVFGKAGWGYIWVSQILLSIIVGA